MKIRRTVVALVSILILLLSIDVAATSFDLSTVSNDERVEKPRESRHLKYHEILKESSSPKVMYPLGSPVFSELSKGNPVIAFDAQGFSALDQGLAAHWYPHYEATLAILIDRGISDATIANWEDLNHVDEDVALLKMDDDEDLGLLLVAMSSGDDQLPATLNKPGRILSDLRQRGRLIYDTDDSPILVGYDYDGAMMKREGRNIEIVIPKDGTLTIQFGVLSKFPMDFSKDLGEGLATAGFRPPGGTENLRFYPERSNYDSARPITDYEDFSELFQGWHKTWRRQVLRTRLYSPVGTYESQMLISIYLVVVTVWIASLVRRILSKEVRKGMIIVGALLMGWVVVRLIKWQRIEIDLVDRYLWYLYYLFQLGIPAVMLWLIWKIDHPSENPRWLVAIIMTNICLFGLVITNEFHQWVFHFETGLSNGTLQYHYNIGMFFVLLGVLIPTIIGGGILLWKSQKMLWLRSSALALGTLVLLILYTIGYLFGVPFARESDVTVTSGVLTLIIIESVIASGLIPANTKYFKLFEHSSLDIQIIDEEGIPIFQSKIAEPIDSETIAKFRAKSQGAMVLTPDSVLYANPTIGGTAFWREDIGIIRRLEQEVETSVKKLELVNSVLAQEQRMLREINEVREKELLFKELREELEDNTAWLLNQIQSVSKDSPSQKQVVTITLALCHLKRRSYIFFKAYDQGELYLEEWMTYIDELKEVVLFAEVRMLALYDVNPLMSVQEGLILYDLVYALMLWALQKPNTILLMNEVEENVFKMKLLYTSRSDAFVVDESLRQRIGQGNGVIDMKTLDESVGITLRLPLGGKKNG